MSKTPSLSFPIWTISLYLGRRFLFHFGCFFGGFFFLTILLSLTDLLRRTSRKGDVGFGTVLEMTFLNSFSVMEILIPFAFFLSAMSCFYALSQKRELIAIRIAGVPSWQFLLAPLLIAFFAGVLQITLYNPISSIFTERFQNLEAVFIKKRASRFTVSDSGLWLRQEQNGKQTILHALRTNPQASTLYDVSIFLYDEENNYTQRIDAKTARLEKGYWKMRDVRRVSQNGTKILFEDAGQHPTLLSEEQVRESFALPEAMSLGALQRFINLAEKTGLAVPQHRVHFHNLLSQPFFLPAMLLLGAVFTLFHMERQRHFARTALVGVLVGVGIYFVLQTGHTLGREGGVSVLFGVWAPVLICWTCGVTLLLAQEE